MEQGAWRPGMASRCAKCGGMSLSYTEDGNARCASCGSVTPPLLAGPPRAASAAPPAPAVEGRPSLRFVTPPGATTAAPTSYPAPPVALGPAGRPRYVSAGDLRRNRIIAGAVLLVIGVLVTAGTYSSAASSPGGGTYFVAFGPIIFGAYLLVRGIATPAPPRR